MKKIVFTLILCLGLIVLVLFYFDYQHKQQVAECRWIMNFAVEHPKLFEKGSPQNPKLLACRDLLFIH